MKRLSICLSALALAMALALPGAALSPSTPFKNNSPIVARPERDDNKTRFDLMYYWYMVPGGYFNDYATVATEEWEWFMYTGGLIVDTNPSGGTLVAVGFQTTHQQFPNQYLYSH